MCQRQNVNHYINFTLPTCSYISSDINIDDETLLVNVYTII